MTTMIFPILVSLLASWLVPAFAQDSRPLRLPFGPGGQGRFGAFHTTLRYTPEWDRGWPVAEHADVVVRFDRFEHRFIFWRGTSYIPCWATAEGPWFTNEFFERRGGPASGTTSMVEPMSDKQARYSQVRVVENHDARVVVHWRYAPVDLDYTQAFLDAQTGWGDWADEYYVIYPDSVGVRRATLYTSAPEEWVEYQESIVINQAGSRPEDGIQAEAIDLANLRGDTKGYTWTAEGGPVLEDPPPGACIQVVNLKASHKPFTIVPPEGARASIYRGHAPGSLFNFWNHWPVSQRRSDTTVARSPSLPSHTSLSHLRWAPQTSTAQSRTWIMLHGMTGGTAAGLVPLAKSWLTPPELELAPGSPASEEGYDPAQRAYRLDWQRPGAPAELTFTLKAGPGAPLVNPALVVSGWGEAGVEVSLDGRRLTPGTDFRFGHGSDLAVANLVVWLNLEANRPIEVTLFPVLSGG